MPDVKIDWSSPESERAMQQPYAHLFLELRRLDSHSTDVSQYFCSMTVIPYPTDCDLNVIQEKILDFQPGPSWPRRPMSYQKRFGTLVPFESFARSIDNPEAAQLRPHQHSEPIAVLETQKVTTVRRT